MEEKSDLEKALLYAAHDGNGGLEVSPTLAKEQKVGEYHQLVSNHDISRLLALQEALECDLPYFQLCSEASIKSHFERFDLPITNLTDLRTFYDAIVEQLGELVQKPGNNIARYEMSHPGTIFGRAAGSLTALEKTISEFEGLKYLFEDALNIVQAIAVRYGKGVTTAVKTKSPGNDTEITVGSIELEPAALEIKKCSSYITQLRLWNGDNTIAMPNHEVYLFPQSHERSIFRRGKQPQFSSGELMILPRRINYIDKYNESIFSQEIGYLSKQFLKTGINCFNIPTLWTCEEFFNMMKKRNSVGDQHNPEFIHFLKLIFNAPRALEQHFQNLDKKIKEDIASLTEHLDK